MHLVRGLPGRRCACASRSREACAHECSGATEARRPEYHAVRPHREAQARSTRTRRAVPPEPERQHPSGWNTTRADSVARQRIRTPPSSVHLRVDNALRVPSILGWTTPSEFRPSRRRTSRRSSRWRASRDMLWRGDSTSSCPPATPPTRRRTRRRSSRCRASRDTLWRGDSRSSCSPATPPTRRRTRRRSSR